MFTWFYDILVSFVYFVLGLFGIQQSQDKVQLLETQSDVANQSVSDLVVETLSCHEDAL